jgi:hypothetical protein
VPPRQKTPAPIDKPLSRAYLREFTGWSTAYPPGVSDPTSLRLMENAMVQRDGSLRIRPGLRYYSPRTIGGLPMLEQPVGSHEPFFLDDGSKAYLFAVRESDGTIGFRVLCVLNTNGVYKVHELDEAGVDFEIPQGYNALKFTSATTYVKYLQIDNKIFALSNAGESMRLFEVGANKQAKVLNSITEPGWVTEDKLSVVHPTQAWINGLVISATRINLCTDPGGSFDHTVWTQNAELDLMAATTSASLGKSTVQPHLGTTHLRVLLDSVLSYSFHYEFPTAAGLSYAASCYMRAASTSMDWRVKLLWYNAAGVLLATTTGTTTSITSAGYTRINAIGVAPANAVKARMRVEVVGTPLDGTWYADSFLIEQSATVNTYFLGDTTDAPPVYYRWAGVPYKSVSYEETFTTADSIPVAATPTADTLISSTAADNTYSFGFFYTFANEVGESAASQVTVVKAQRGWSQWKWETPDAAAAPSGTTTTDPTLCADQLVAIVPEDVWDQALSEGAVKWNLYMMTWSDQEAIPVVAIRVARVDLVTNPDYDSEGWAVMTPQQADVSSEIVALPSEASRYNYSNPSHGGQGIVASDRMVMVFDPMDPGVIRWSSNEQGNYTDFSANKGGGYKTLTSGNLYVPAVVKLWQNPQSVDTLTILCLGVDGHSTGYYMSPAQIASQSEAVNVMGFEETTATPGTTSPYGCEVLNNALYHPLDEQLMKSTATNYNINHSSLTDQIQNVWRGLVDKHHIVSSQLDNRIYFVVHNPLGEDLEEHCWGNEIWVLDAAQKQGSWSRWLVQSQSLRKIQVDGQVVMSVVRPDGIYYFDESSALDHYVEAGVVEERSIPWYVETNTQGANRAHDAMAHLQQANLTVGNFRGVMRYGIRGRDVNGKPVDISKLLHDSGAVSADGTTFDLESYLRIAKGMKEWFFYAGSVTEDNEVQFSTGQLSLVQYRYTPLTVNTGYDYGSVETFEYGRGGNLATDRTSDDGVPYPMIDTGRP